MFTANILRGPLVAAALALPGLSGAAISPALSETVRQLAQAQSQDLEAIFQQVHANPELAFQLDETAALVAKKLKKMG